MDNVKKIRNAHAAKFGIGDVSISCRHNYNYKILFDHTAVAVYSKCKKRVKAWMLTTLIKCSSAIAALE